MKQSYIDGQLLKDLFINGAYELEKNKELVNSLNVFPVPDGDTGTNMSATILSAVSELEKIKNITVRNVCDAIAMGSLMGARGNSGVILSQLLRGFAKYLKDKEKISTNDFAMALKEGVTTAYKAVMKPTEGTILTVARETADKAIEIAKKENDFEVFMKRIYEHSNISLNKTPEMLPVLKQAGVVDAGGKGLALIYYGYYKMLIGEVNTKESLNIEKVKEIKYDEIDTSEIKFAYCTEFFIKTKNGDPDKFRDIITKYGDSIVSVGTEELIKVHIHTNNPGIVLEEGLKIGELIKIKIDNMKEQHRSIVEEDVDIEKDKEDNEEKEYGFVAISFGEGFKQIFEELGVDEIIEGGQTMNPSTQDILNSINKINAKNIFIYPNNKNIILAAEQAKDLSNKNVIVIPTKSIPQGITAMLNFNPEANAKENEEEMAKAMLRVKTGQVTFAVRDTVMNDVEVKEGNIIGIFNGKLINAGKDINETTKQLIDAMLDDDTELVSIFYGNDLKEEDAQEIQYYFEEKYPDIDFSLNYGGQPIYYYIISAE
ncbi:DAK2 domain protein [Caloramator mitchellensis]|uniref:DAK2 domain protein n=1 Tax=Caloramator mitchellensis TaxID=908809 RepID=A0A0R3JTT1_CALMK|nr:DAK2 domain-containing protein [Caloramator mitchellensis]KRQ86937.1 DAK2 domain protein [Caloramator mitchellensis]